MLTSFFAIIFFAIIVIMSLCITAQRTELCHPIGEPGLDEALGIQSGLRGARDAENLDADGLHAEVEIFKLNQAHE